jgi:hypothetical protein
MRAQQWPSTYSVVDVHLTGLDTDSVKEAHVAGINVINTFLDRVAFVSYAQCTLLKAVSTCKASVEPGQAFDIATGDLYLNVETQTVTPESIAPFEGLPPDSVIDEAVHDIRKAFLQSSTDQHLLFLYTAAERIAKSESTENQKIKCKSCGAETDGPPATRNAIRNLLGDRGVPPKDCNDASDYRGRIAHGGGRRDLAFYERVTGLAGTIEGAVLSSIAARAGVKILQRHNVVLAMPIAIMQATKNENGTFSIGDAAVEIPANMTKVDVDVSEPGGTVRFGVHTENGRPKIDPLAWPD